MKLQMVAEVLMVTMIPMNVQNQNRMLGHLLYILLQIQGTYIKGLKFLRLIFYSVLTF